MYFWFEDLERGLFLLSRYPLLHGFLGRYNWCFWLLSWQRNLIFHHFFRSCMHKSREPHGHVLPQLLWKDSAAIFAQEPPCFIWHWHLFNESTSSESATSSQQENWRPIVAPIIQIMSMKVRCTPDTGRSSESHICNCRIAVAENVSSIGRLASNNVPYERQTARLNRETVRQAQIKSNPSPIIWLYASRSALANLIPGLSHKKPSATQKKWQWESGGEVDVESVGAWIIMNQGA